jgi:hypothetical protein
MPLTAGLRDEENERINNILKRLVALDYVPEMGNEKLDEILKDLAMSGESLLIISPVELVELVKKLHFDWQNAEAFADLLLKLSVLFGMHFKRHALAVYEFIQRESKTFSLGISTKIASLKAELQ